MTKKANSIVAGRLKDQTSSFDNDLNNRSDEGDVIMGGREDTQSRQGRQITLGACQGYQHLEVKLGRKICKPARKASE